MRALSSRVRPIVVGLVTALLALHAWLAVSATIDLGVTGDETVHLTGGYSYWRFNDYRLHPENGILPQRWAALPLLISKPQLEPETRPELWQHSDVWRIGQNFFFESGNSIDYLMLCARSMSVLWSVATGLLVFFWSRSLWSEIGGVFSLLLYVVSPTILGHGPLVTSDMCATFWLLAATGAWWRLTERVTVRRFAISVVVTSLAVVAKFSSVVLVPVFALIVLWRIVSGIASGDKNGPTLSLRCALSKLALWFSVGAAHLSSAAGLVWACFGFRYTAFTADLPVAVDFFSSYQLMLPTGGMGRWLLVHAQELRLLPEAFLQGFAYVLYAARERPAFLAGEYSSTGWWWFFPFAFLVKSSVAELLVFAAVPVAFALRWFRNRADALRRAKSLISLLIFAAVYGGVSLASNLNIGQRHILPLYPVLFILAGALVSRFVSTPTSPCHREVAAAGRGDPSVRLQRTPLRSAVAVTLLPLLIASLAIIESVSIRPHYLAFFNQLAGGPDNGWRLLGDSSLDWGQNLPRLATWLEENRKPNELVYLSYFGADDPFYRGVQPIELSPYSSFSRELRWQPLNGGLYCIGASMLQDTSSPYSGPWTPERERTYQQLRARINQEIEAGTRSPVFIGSGEPDVEIWNLDRLRFARLCVYLRMRSPDAVIGHVIFVFRLTDDEIKNAVDGSLADLASAMEAAESKPH